MKVVFGGGCEVEKWGSKLFIFSIEQAGSGAGRAGSWQGPDTFRYVSRDDDAVKKWARWKWDADDNSKAVARCVMLALWGGSRWSQEVVPKVQCRWSKVASGPLVGGW